ncbi:MAG: DUF1566 domain-containing protein [Candidatus Tritonobacter lacicola]|nr:DUF1566 domain-containing protein [Candidatus Tritonobacter lacicola]
MKKLMTVVLSAMFVIGLSGAVQAGDIDPTGPPSAGSGMYTLQDIYDYLTAGEAPDLPGFFKEPTNGPGTGTMKSLKEIYDDIKALFVQCNATVADVATGKKFFCTQSGSWGVQDGAASGGTNYGLPKTGQQTSSGTGDDPDYSDPAGPDIGYPRGTGSWTAYNADGGRFTDNGNGTVTDNATGLMWEQKTPSNNTDGYSFVDALDYCENQIGTDGTYAGHDDWRLPNLMELMSLFVFKNPGQYFDYTAFPNTPGYPDTTDYWSSTNRLNDSSSRFSVEYSGGVPAISSSGNNSPLYVRAVRGGG